jgi:hypothetical protein
MKIQTSLIPFVIFLRLVAPGSTAQAVSPAPDGGYPGGNTAEGQNALLSLTGGTYNTAVGLFSLRSDTTGSYNTAIGAGALFVNAAEENTATGFAALLSNATGFGNTANGALALFSNTTANFNTATGQQALFYNTTGFSNTATGAGALSSNTTGSQNTAIGLGALDNNTTGSSNIALGDGAGANVTTASDVICIGTAVAGNNVSSSCYIGNIFDAPSSGGESVLINSNGRLGTTASSRRFKEEIKPMEQASELLFALRPVTFRYKKKIDPAGTPQFGLVAEDVEKVTPSLVVRDKGGKPYSVRYDQVNAMLLNEFLKEHKAFIDEQRKVEEQQATITELKKDFRATVAQLATRLDEQAAQIQRVSAQLEASKPAPQVVNNP